MKPNNQTEGWTAGQIMFHWKHLGRLGNQAVCGKALPSAVWGGPPLDMFALNPEDVNCPDCKCALAKLKGSR